MVFEYYVIVDTAGHAGLAATKRTAVETELAEQGGKMICVNAANAFQARRQAIELWQGGDQSAIH